MRLCECGAYLNPACPIHVGDAERPTKDALIAALRRECEAAEVFIESCRARGVIYRSTPRGRAHEEARAARLEIDK